MKNQKKKHKVKKYTSDGRVILCEFNLMRFLVLVGIIIFILCTYFGVKTVTEAINTDKVEFASEQTIEEDDFQTTYVLPDDYDDTSQITTTSNEATTASSGITTGSNGEYVLPDDYYDDISQITTLRLNSQTYSSEEMDSCVKKVTYNSGLWGYAVKLDSTKEYLTYEKPLTIYFKNVGTVGDITLDAEVSVINVGFSENYNKVTPSTSGYAMFFGITTTGLRVGEYKTTSNSYFPNYAYGNTYSVSYKITLKNADTGKNVSTPVVIGTDDIDWTDEMWSVSTDFNLYRYSGCECNITKGESTWSVVGVHSGDNGLTSTEDMWVKGGCYFFCEDPTNINCYYQGYGSTYAEILIYSIYDNQEAPVKTVTSTGSITVDSENYYVKGDTVTYTLTMTLPSFATGVFCPYDSFVLEDTLPQGLALNGCTFNVYSADGTSTSWSRIGNSTIDHDTNYVAVEPNADQLAVGSTLYGARNVNNHGFGCS